MSKPYINCEYIISRHAYNLRDQEKYLNLLRIKMARYPHMELSSVHISYGEFEQLYIRCVYHLDMKVYLRHKLMNSEYLPTYEYQTFSMSASESITVIDVNVGVGMKAAVEIGNFTTY